MSLALSIPTDMPERPAPFAPDEAKGIEVRDQPTYEKACAALKEIKAVRRQIEADRKQLKEGVLQAGRAIDDKARAADGPWKQAEEWLAPRITGYLEAQERERRAEQARLEAEARRLAEEEQLAAAIAAEAAGASAAEVEAIVNETPTATMAIAPARVERVAGISTPETWSAEVTDHMAFKRWAVQQLQFHMLEVRMPALNAMARAQRGNLNIPGVRAVPTRGARARL